MIIIREATLDDVTGIREVFQSEYGEHYAYPQYYDPDVLARLVYSDSSVLLVAVDSESNRVAGTASVVFSVGAHDDLIGEFGRLVVHSDFRARGIGGQLMKARIELVSSRIHVGIVENRAAHEYSQRISQRFGFVPVGFVPMKFSLERREPVAIYSRHFGDALALRRNNPHIIPEAAELASFSLENCGLRQDAIIDDTSAAYANDEGFDLDELKTEGFASLLRIERGRLRHRDVFGPVRLHYGRFQLQARHSHYLIARRKKLVVGGIGYMIDEAEKAVRVIELIALSDKPIRCLLEALVEKCRTELAIEYLEVDVSAYAPRMQRTLLEMGFLPVSYVPANVFHNVERLDAMKMSRLFVPLEEGETHLREAAQPIADSVMKSFRAREILPRIAHVSQKTRLFEGLNEEQRQRLLALCPTVQFQKGEQIFGAGGCDGVMHLVLSGKVELSADGLSVGSVQAGQCLGESCLLHSPGSMPAHTVDAVATTSVETAEIPCQAFHALIRLRPDIGLVVYRNLALDAGAKLKASLHRNSEN